MALDRFEEIVEPLKGAAPDPDLTGAARAAMRVATFYGTLRKMNVPAAAAREFTGYWMADEPGPEE